MQKLTITNQTRKFKIKKQKLTFLLKENDQSMSQNRRTFGRGIWKANRWKAEENSESTGSLDDPPARS